MGALLQHSEQHLGLGRVRSQRGRIDLREFPCRLELEVARAFDELRLGRVRGKSDRVALREGKCLLELIPNRRAKPASHTHTMRHNG